MGTATIWTDLVTAATTDAAAWLGDFGTVIAYLTGVAALALVIAMLRRVLG